MTTTDPTQAEAWKAIERIQSSVCPTFSDRGQFNEGRISEHDLHALIRVLSTPQPACPPLNRIEGLDEALKRLEYSRQGKPYEGPEGAVHEWNDIVLCMKAAHAFAALQQSAPAEPERDLPCCYTLTTDKGEPARRSGDGPCDRCQSFAEPDAAHLASVEMFDFQNGKHADIVERLRGKVRIPITDGLGPVGGQEYYFERTFPSSNAANEAADYIERLRAVLKAAVMGKDGE
jgi:hypothetical protein